METQPISAANKIFGRFASQVAAQLRGKNRIEFEPRLQSREKVVVVDVEKLIFSGKKMSQKKYFRYSGYPGGLKTRFLKEEFKKSPARVFRQAVYHMLPKNRQRDQTIKNLIIQ